jgi:subtilase family serine protease
MPKLRSLSVSLLAGLLFCAASLPSQQATAPLNRVTDSINDQQLVTLKGTVHPLANASNDRGAAPDSLPLERMHLYLKRSDSQEAALKQLIADQHTPGSANYHKWLTPDEFGKQFGPSDQDIAALQTWLTGHGFSVAKVNPGKLTMEISGSVAQMRSAFHTQIHKYQVNGETHYANATDPKIPSALAPVLGGFVSLNNFRLKSYAHKLGKASYDPKTGKATPQWTIGSGTVNPANYNFVLSPADYAVQYDLKPLYTAGVNGAGQAIAIINDSNINVGLVNQFRTLFGLTANPPQVIIDGDDPGVDGISNYDGPNYDSVEAYLDVEWSGAVAPSATVDLVIAADTALSNGLELAAERAVYSNIAPVMSISFGQCEYYLGSENSFLSGLWEQAAAQGITVMVSTGDSGSAGCDDDNSQYYAVDGQAVNGFASTPYNVAVGGTDFYYSQYNSTSTTALNNQLATYWNTTASNATPTASIQGYIPEQPWNDSQYGLNILSEYTLSGDLATSMAAGSGGASNAAICSSNTYNSTTGYCSVTPTGYPKPTWQAALTPADGVRDLPDVSLFASSGVNDSYYPICATDGDCTQVNGGSVQIYGVGGTSASSPSFAGIMALVNQKYGRQGQANTVLYPLAAQYPAAFHDVTVGTNTVPCEYAPTDTTNCIAPPSSNSIVLGSITEGQIGTGSTPQYNAGTGYDLATGLGTIDANVLVTNWGNVKLAATQTTLNALSPAQATYAHGTAITFSGAVSETSGSGTPTGNVALLADSTEQGQQGQNIFTLTSGGYSGSVSTLPGGTYNVWTQYGGDSSNASSTSTKTQITINPETPGINFNIFSGNYYSTTGSGNGPGSSVDYGTQLMLSALVAPSAQLSAVQNCVINGCTTPPAFTTPTGTVAFTDGASALNNASINAEGDAEYNAAFSVGSHSVTAAYPGDKSYNAVTSGAIAFTVVQDQPKILINAPIATTSGSLINGSGQPTILSVQVENYAQYSSGLPTPVAAPTGTIVYTSSPTGISGSVTLSPAVDPNTSAVEGVANITIPAGTAAGNYTVTITYNGDTNYVGEKGNITVPIANVTGLASTTAATITGSISPTSTLTINGTVTGAGTAAPTSSSTLGTGVLVFVSGDSANNNYLGEAYFSSSASNVSSFSFTLNSQSLPQGANLITLQYTGDSVYQPSAVVLNAGSPISNPLSDFTLIPTTTNQPVTAGSSATDTIQLASVNGFSGTVNLTCTAAAGVGCAIGSTAGLSSGGSTTATLTVTAPTDTANQTYNVLVKATDAATGKYVHTLGINAVVTGSTVGTKSFALGAGTTSLSLDASNTVNNSGASAITVTPLGGFTGSVALSCAVTPVGSTSPTCSVGSPVTLGAAQTQTLTVITSSTTAAGTYTVTVTGTSGSITITTPVSVGVGTPSFTAANSGAVTIATQGATGTATITVTPTNGFTGTVSLSCVVAGPSGANDPATCSIPASVSITSTTAQTATLTITTTAATAMSKPPQFFWPATGGTALAVLFLFGISKKRRGWLAMLGVLVLMITAAAIGCGGGGSSNNTGSSSNSGTTPGTYTVTVTATSGSGSSAITQTTAVTVTVN